MSQSTTGKIFKTKNMNLRTYISISSLILSLLHAQAQLTREDSIRLKKMLEGEEEIIINTEAVKDIEFNFMPKETLLKQKPLIADEKPWMKFIEKLPDDFIRKITPDLKMTFTLDIDPLSIPAAPMATFSADKFLFETFTARGRAIKHNRKHANAWKRYKDYVPTKEDSLNWYKYKKRIPKDTLAIVTTKDSASHHFMNTK